MMHENAVMQPRREGKSIGTKKGECVSQGTTGAVGGLSDNGSIRVIKMVRSSLLVLK